jgi:hypothetical protein
MDSDGGSPASPIAHDYSQLSDAQLRSAIRFAEQHLRSLEQDHLELLRVYRDEINALRRHLVDRILRRLTTAASALSETQRLDLCRTLDARQMRADDIAAMVRGVTKGRTDRLDALTEIEGMALQLRLQQES